MSRNVQGTVYLIHFAQRYKHAAHYLGWAKDLQARLDHHADGSGANLMRVIKEAGITWQLARTWPGDRYRERQLKAQGGRSRMCPVCIEAKKETREMVQKDDACNAGPEIDHSHEEHADYPHEPGTLYDCGACETQDCQHEAGDGDEWCVSGHHPQPEIGKEIDDRELGA